LLLYGLWLISAIIIISADGFSLRFDIPWFVLFSSILTLAWFAKYKITGDKKLFFYEDIPAKHQRIFIFFFIILSLSMVLSTL